MFFNMFFSFFSSRRRRRSREPASSSFAHPLLFALVFLSLSLSLFSPSSTGSTSRSARAVSPSRGCGRRRCRRRPPRRRRGAQARAPAARRRPCRRHGGGEAAFRCCLRSLAGSRPGTMRSLSHRRASASRGAGLERKREEKEGGEREEREKEMRERKRERRETREISTEEQQQFFFFLFPPFFLFFFDSSYPSQPRARPGARPPSSPRGQTCALPGRRRGLWAFFGGRKGGEAREGRLFSSSSSSRSRKAKRVMRRREANFFFSLARSLFFFSLSSPSFYFFICQSFFLFLSHFSDLQLSIDGGENKKKGRGERGGRGPDFSKKGVLRGGCICSTFRLCFWCFLVVARGDKKGGGTTRSPRPRRRVDF